jgi:hypothetical protein
MSAVWFRWLLFCCVLAYRGFSADTSGIDTSGAATIDELMPHAPSICLVRGRSASSSDVATYIFKYIPAHILALQNWNSHDDLMQGLKRPRFLVWGEIFAGTGGMSQALREHMHVSPTRGRPIDIDIDPMRQNILCDVGYSFILPTILQMVPLAFTWWGCPCWSWIFM